MRIVIALLVLAIPIEAYAVCGSRGGPGFRGPNGKCIGWKQLGKVCGNPPKTFCTYEGGGIGDTNFETGTKYIAAGAAALGAAGGSAKTMARAFDERTIRADGIACTSQRRLTELRSCSPGVCAVRFNEEAAVQTCVSDCAKLHTLAVDAGECARVTKGAGVKIKAGSHSFEWVRIKHPYLAKEMWIERGLVLK